MAKERFIFVCLLLTILCLSFVCKAFGKRNENPGHGSEHRANPENRGHGAERGQGRGRGHSSQGSENRNRQGSNSVEHEGLEGIVVDPNTSVEEKVDFRNSDDSSPTSPATTTFSATVELVTESVSESGGDIEIDAATTSVSEPVETYSEPFTTAESVATLTVQTDSSVADTSTIELTTSETEITTSAANDELLDSQQHSAQKPKKQVKGGGSKGKGSDKRLKEESKKHDKKTQGSIRHEGRKENKAPRMKNPKIYIFKGKVFTMEGPSGDTVPPVMQIANFSRLPAYGKSCIVTGLPIVRSNATINDGPKSAGLQVEHFKPCQDRKRGSKQIKKARQQPGRQKRSETYSSISWLWPDPENIPYMFEGSYPASMRPGARKAFQFWENFTCLRFVEKPTGTLLQQSHILLGVTPSGSCSTDRLGPAKFPPYSTKIDVTQCINKTGSVAHEIGHALGLSHSQKRTDRDQAVSLSMENIAPSWQSQFDRDNDRQFDNWGVPYYYDSIMHYFPYAASSNGLMTICPLDPIMEAVMGQREEPAFGDISLVNRIYCQENCFNRAELGRVNFTGSLSMTISGRNCQAWNTQTPHKHRYTSIGNHDNCRNADNWSGGPWCYTTDPSVPYEPCFAACEDLAANNRPYCHGWCYNGGYHHPDSCECVCPRYANGEYCENLDLTIKHAHVPCGGQLILKKGLPMGLSTPNWPHNYTTESLCIWWIQAPKNMKVRANVSDFLMEVPDESGCYDYVEIRKSICAAKIAHPEDMRFCGNSLAPDANTGAVKSIISDDENMVLKFVTDDHENARGFSIILEVI